MKPVNSNKPMSLMILHCNVRLLGIMCCPQKGGNINTVKWTKPINGDKSLSLMLFALQCAC